MNDPIKQLIAGAILALVGSLVGATLVMWTTAEIRGQRSGISVQSPVMSGQGSVFSGQRMAQNPVIAIAPKSAGTTNTGKRLVISSPTGAMSYNQFQKMQELPEVKKAREEFLEAQRKYSEVVKKAMEAKKTEDGGRKTEIGGQRTEGRGRRSVGRPEPVISIQ
jgi:hypothetical protein